MQHTRETTLLSQKNEFSLYHASSLRFGEQLIYQRGETSNAYTGYIWQEFCQYDLLQYTHGSNMYTYIDACENRDIHRQLRTVHI